MMGGGIAGAELDRQVVEQRLVETTRQLVATRSFPGEESKVAASFAAQLRNAGAEIEIDETFPGSPSVIARMGNREAKQTLQLAGHVDTIPSPHSAPHVRNRRIYGRGACDMKAALAAITEVVRVLQPVMDQIPLRLLITAYGLHEGPGAAPMHAPVRDLIRRGIVGDAVIVCEGSKDLLPVAGKGSLIFKVRFHRAGTTEHELLHVGDIPNPVMAAHEFVSRLKSASARWTSQHDLLGPETYFIGAIRGGDLYNRIPIEATVEGTRRYPPPVRAVDAADEIRRIVRDVERTHDLRAQISLQRSGQPFEIDPSSQLAATLRSSYAEITGRELTLGGQQFASDVNHFVLDARIPTAAHGTDPIRAHATPEYVSIDDIVRFTRVILRTVLHYAASFSPRGE
jgi:acetylornithine deacetylase/succinyl-diaminopimelate desuccinylase-like protein